MAQRPATPLRAPPCYKSAPLAVRRNDSQRETKYCKMALLFPTTVLSLSLTLLLLLVLSSSAFSGHDGITAAKPSAADSVLGHSYVDRQTQSTKPQYSEPRLFGIRAPPSNKATRYSLSSEPLPSPETHPATPFWSKINEPPAPRPKTDHGSKPSWAMPPPPPKTDYGATPFLAIPPAPPKTTDEGATPFWKIPPPQPKTDHGTRHFWAKTNVPRVPVTPLKTHKVRPDNPIPPPSGAPPPYPRRL
ncbi:hypothetical protein H6P81_020845 [Aristolochia fimbriata]|uniref:Proline-rich extensin-like protein EPR1 n=1 Tax=Aristolochia fimbriata TaxID=158543 RepID=A0AAV7DXC2_ARIFI|nr:hypothetical protein H6P81_020845 [Aristolochia fimbriata]